MTLPLRPLLISGLLSSLMLMTACNSKDTTGENNSSEPKDASQEVMDQLKSKPIKQFASTPNDSHDIALFDEYQKKFDENSQALEADLKKRDAEGTLNEEIDHKLKRDSIESAMNMLKALELKTEQGRYVQGLYYQYWENQAKVYDEKKQAKDGELNTPSDAVKGMGDMFTADEQLEHWKQNTQ